jgi:hypothetical protein
VERRQVPLKVVPDEIAVSPGTTRIPFGGGTVQLPNGNTFQVTSGSITITVDPGYGVTAARIQELAARLDALTRQGNLAQNALTDAIRMGALEPAEPAKPGKSDSLTGVNELWPLSCENSWRAEGGLTGAGEGPGRQRRPQRRPGACG